jgi:hypothetical protein
MFTLFGRSKLLLLLYNKSCFVVKIKKSVEVNKKQNLVELVIVHHSFSPVRVVRLANQPCECVQEVQQQQTTLCAPIFFIIIITSFLVVEIIPSLQGERPIASCAITPWSLQNKTREGGGG